jgi:hypothetical protein
MHHYVDHVLRLNTKNATVRRRSLQVFHMLRSPALLFHPGTVSRVFWQAFSESRNFRQICHLRHLRRRLQIPSPRSIGHTGTNPSIRPARRLDSGEFLASLGSRADFPSQ